MPSPAPTSQVMTFMAVAAARPRGGISIALPVQPAEVWGDRDRYYLAGTIGHHAMRGVVVPGDGDPTLELGPTWCRDRRVGPGATVQVSLRPEGPQLDEMAVDFADAIRADPGARRFFESLATFYRKGFVRWVDGAKRPETRARRIEDTVAALKAGRQEP
ncbi:MAG TPA: YdeI/OmpD-associated family protein [Candidatus Limnocylindria bacterium]